MTAGDPCSSAYPDFSGDPPDRWWSDYSEDELREELASLLGLQPDEVFKVGTEGLQGAAWAVTTHGRRYRFVGDGMTTAYEEIGT